MTAQIEIEKHCSIHTPSKAIRYQIFRQGRPDTTFKFYMGADSYDIADDAFSTARDFEPHFVVLVEFKKDGNGDYICNMLRSYSCTEFPLKSVNVGVII